MLILVIATPVSFCKLFSLFYHIMSEPQHDKTNIMTCACSELRSAWPSAQSDLSSLCALWVAGSPCHFVGLDVLRLNYLIRCMQYKCNFKLNRLTLSWNPFKPNCVNHQTNNVAYSSAIPNGCRTSSTWCTGIHHCSKLKEQDSKCFRNGNIRYAACYNQSLLPIPKRPSFSTEEEAYVPRTPVFRQPYRRDFRSQ